MSEYRTSRRIEYSDTDASGTVHFSLAEAGDTEGALATATTIYPGGKEQALSYIAEIQARRGEFVNALQIAETISSAWIQATTLADIAQHTPRAGNAQDSRAIFERAFDTASSIPLEVGGSPSRAQCFRNIAWKQAQSGNAAGAIRQASEEPPLLRSRILVGIATGLLDRREEDR